MFFPTPLEPQDPVPIVNSGMETESSNMKIFKASLVVTEVEIHNLNPLRKVEFYSILKLKLLAFPLNNVYLNPEHFKVLKRPQETLIWFKL